MKNQKGISALAGIVIVIAIAVVAFGGVFAYQYFSTKTDDQLQVSSENQNQQQQTESQQKNNVQNVGNETENITIKPYEYIKDDFDMNDRSFSVKTADGKLFKVLVTDKTKIYYTVNDGSEANNGKGNILTPSVSFSDFAEIRNSGFKLIGIAAMGDETIKGFLSSDGTMIEATEIFWIFWGVQ